MIEQAARFAKKNWVLPVAGALMLAPVSLFFVYTMRVYYGFDMFPELFMYAFAYLFSLTCYALFYFTTKYSEKNLPLAAFWLILFCGVLFALANPPLQAPDEHYHFWRIYTMAGGELNFDMGRVMPHDLNVLMAEFPPFYTYYHSGEVALTPLEHIFRYFERLKESGFPNSGESYAFSLIPYIPAALLVAPFKALGANALICLYIARVANALVYALICFLALKNLKVNRGLFLVFMMMPLTLFLAGSSSYDSPMIACIFLLFSLVFTDSFTKRHFLLAAVLTGFITYLKPNNFLLVVPIMFAKNWQCGFTSGLLKGRSLPRLTLPIAGGAVYLILSGITNLQVTYFSNMVEIARNDSVDPMAQLEFIFNNLPAAAAIMFGTVFENTFFITQLGLFGWLDTNISFTTVFSVVLLLLFTISYDSKQYLHRFFTPTLFIVSLAYAASVVVAIYLVHTPAEMGQVIGLQARYFLPTYFGLLICLGQLLQRWVKPYTLSPAVAVLSTGFVSVSTAILLFLTYNVMV